MRRSTVVQGDDYAYEDEQGEHGGTKLVREILEVAILTVLFFGELRHVPVPVDRLIPPC